MFYHLFASEIYPVRLSVLERQDKFVSITDQIQHILFQKINLESFFVCLNIFAIGIFVVLYLSLDNLFTYAIIGLNKYGIIFKRQRLNERKLGKALDKVVVREYIYQERGVISMTPNYCCQLEHSVKILLIFMRKHRIALDFFAHTEEI